METFVFRKKHSKVLIAGNQSVVCAWAGVQDFDTHTCGLGAYGSALSLPRQALKERGTFEIKIMWGQGINYSKTSL